LSSLQRLAPFSCSGHPSLAVEGLLPVVWSNPWAESPSSPHCSVLPAVSLGFTRVGFYKRMKSSLLTIKREPRGAHPFSFSAAAGWPQGKHSPAASRERGGWGMGLPIPREQLRGSILKPKGRTSVRDRSMSPRLVLAASKSTYALCSGSLIRKIELGWGSTM
jgi:hypothetical protein